jgi:hypothetical protein
MLKCDVAGALSAEAFFLQSGAAWPSLLLSVQAVPGLGKQGWTDNRLAGEPCKLARLAGDFAPGIWQALRACRLSNKMASDARAFS